MTIASLQEIYGRAFDRLSAEIEAYESDAQLWQIPPGIHNPGGTLCLHLLGNINHFIGALLGYTGYERQRDLEFSQRDVPRQDLLTSLCETQKMVLRVLGKLDEAALHKIYPVELSPGARDTEYMLVFFAFHFEYHLGQINYHRRLTKA